MKRILLLTALLALAACQKAPKVYTLAAGDISMTVTDFGARVISLKTPDREGKLANIVIGHETAKEYVNPEGERFLGACVGPVANRIGGARFEVDGVEYRTPENDHGHNTLHGGFTGVDNLYWDVVSRNDTSIVFHLLHLDGMEGYPGNLDIKMTYSLNSLGEFKITYMATTDKPTPVNLTHHPFFCLRGDGKGRVEQYVMRIKASRYIPIDEESIPTGEIASVEGTPFDFREPHLIGERISQDNEQLRNGRGYDHNWCIDKVDPFGVEFVCSVYDPESGRYIEVFSDQPGLQFYSGNFFTGDEYRASLALETQQWPDAINHPAFGDIILRPGWVYTQTCIYRFSSL